MAPRLLEQNQRKSQSSSTKRDAQTERVCSSSCESHACETTRGSFKDEEEGSDSPKEASIAQEASISPKPAILPGPAILPEPPFPPNPPIRPSGPLLGGFQSSFTEALRDLGLTPDEDRIDYAISQLSNAVWEKLQPRIDEEIFQAHIHHSPPRTRAACLESESCAEGGARGG